MSAPRRRLALNSGTCLWMVANRRRGTLTFSESPLREARARAAGHGPPGSRFVPSRRTTAIHTSMGGAGKGEGFDLRCRSGAHPRSPAGDSRSKTWMTAGATAYVFGLLSNLSEGHGTVAYRAGTALTDRSGYLPEEIHCHGELYHYCYNEQMELDSVSHGRGSFPVAASPVIRVCFPSFSARAARHSVVK